MKKELVLIAMLAVAAPACVQAQQIYRIAFVGSGAPGPGIESFRQGMRDLGYVEGKNLHLHVRFPGAKAERIPQLIDEAIALKPHVIVVGSTPAALAAKRATSKIPIVFGSLFDPVGSGVVANLAQPGSNITGVAIGVGGSGMAGKWVELLKEGIPSLTHVAVLSNPRNPASVTSAREVEAAARAMSIRFNLLDGGNAPSLESSLATVAASGAHALIVTNDPFFTSQRARLIEFAARARLPTMYFFATFAEDGGLMAYGASQQDAYRRAAAYVDRILKGAKPGDLPIEQPTRLELVINMKTARALGLKIPPSLLVRADRVID